MTDTPRIIAKFRPQAWAGDTCLDVDGEYEFDCTDLILAMPREEALAIDDVLEEFTVVIGLGNDAFADEPRAEVARILRVIAHQVANLVGAVDDGPADRAVLDENGNTVGRWVLR